MEVYLEQSRIITPFLPSLLHLATVKVSLLLKTKFDHATLMKAFKRIQEEALIDFDEIYRSPNFLNNKLRLLKCRLYHLQCKYELLRSGKVCSVIRKRRLELRRRVLEKRRNFLERSMFEYFKTDPLMKQYKAQQIINKKIPTSLRPRVIEAVQGMEFEVRMWKSVFDKIELREEDRRFCWKPDGSLDETETVRQMVLNENIDIKNRFIYASNYCCEESMHSLWSEVVNSNETEYLITYDDILVNFWVRRMEPNTWLDWKDDFHDYLHRNPDDVYFIIESFPILPPEDRELFLPYLKYAPLDDFRRCFNVMTNEEEEWILQNCPGKLLLSFLMWPLRSMFLETVDKICNYIDEHDFLFIFDKLFLIKKYEQFDISDLFTGFWERSPKHYRSSMMSLPFMKKKINSLLKEIRKKRKLIWRTKKSKKEQG